MMVNLSFNDHPSELECVFFIARGFFNVTAVDDNVDAI